MASNQTLYKWNSLKKSFSSLFFLKHTLLKFSQRQTYDIYIFIINSLKPLPLSQIHRPQGALGKMMSFSCHLVAECELGNWEPNCSVTCCCCNENSCQSAKTKWFKVIIVSKLSFTPFSADWCLLPRKQSQRRVAEKSDSPFVRTALYKRQTVTVQPPMVPVPSQLVPCVNPFSSQNSHPRNIRQFYPEVLQSLKRGLFKL